MKLALISLLLVALQISCCRGVDWVRAGMSTNQPLWGIREGLRWAIDPAGFRPNEPRGLIRLGAPVLPGSNYDLVNFLAIEPIVHGRRGFSELERSQTDGKPGKQIIAGTDAGASSGLYPGTIRHAGSGVEILTVPLLVERFDNGAHVRLVASQRSDRPDELEIAVFAQPDSTPLEYCIITATMGNMARARRLWIKNEVIDSRELYGQYRESGFAPHQEFPLRRLSRNAAGDVLAAMTTDEPNPAQVFPFPGSTAWHYGGAPVTQYWRVPEADVQVDLCVVVNGRFKYWQSDQPVPGGVAFENFEMRQKFRTGQRFIFGITPRKPADLGL